MAQKNHKRVESKATAGGISPRAEVERLIQKERFKDAVKQGKLCYRAESTPENHRLLEKAYFLRARQLLAERMPTAAAEVAQHLLDFGVTDPELTPDLASLLIKVGLSGPAMAMRDRLESPEAQSKLMLTAADQAVLHPEQAFASMPEICQGAIQVREALEAVEAGDETRALNCLREIARNSPFADWRYFTRGLAASRRGDAEQVAANWDRLDPERSAARIARFLRAPAAEQTAAAISPTMETQVFGEPILDRMERLQTLVAEERWTEALRLVAPLRFALQRVDPRLAERLTLVLLSSLVQVATQCESEEEARTLVGGFTRLAQPLPIDPRWNRLWALIWEDTQFGFERAEEHWRAYLQDLENLAPLSPEERVRAQALVWKHLGEMYIDDAEVDDEYDDGYDDEFFQPRFQAQKGPNQESQRRAAACLEESIRIDPTHLAAHQILIEAHLDWKHADQALAAMRRLLGTFPDDFDTLSLLAKHHIRQDQGAEALPHAIRARELKPLDRTAKLDEYSARASLARRFVIEGRCDEARAELARIEAASGEVDSRYIFLARRTVVELKDAQEQRAQELIKEAQGLLSEPTPFWLALLIEAARCQLPKAVKDRFEHHWQAGIAQKCKGETAALLADRMTTFRISGIDYPGRAKHVAEVVDYITQGSRVKYRREELLLVCEFLSDAPNATGEFEKLAARGLKNFPDSAFFIHAGVVAEIRKKGPFRVNLRKLEPKLQAALAAARASSDPVENRIEADVKKSLTMVAQLKGMPFRMFFGPDGSMPKSFGDMAAQMGFMDDDDDDWDDDDEEAAPNAGRPAQSGTASPGPKQKKR